ncbi:hypothetical protein A9G29_06170 [Gilliamella sp. Fer2-1]|jgi:hypothetical protein|nr:hypothetical protein A9G29_06170 [Gilliamella apicola]
MFALVAALIAVVVGLIVGVVGSHGKKNQKKIEADEFKTGTSTEGTEIPIVFGTVKITNPIYTWIGDKSLQAIRKKGGKK